MDAIVAVYQDWGIGAEGTQPVALSADRRYFREKTRNAWVIVGRNTLADFPGGRPLSSPGEPGKVPARRWSTARKRPFRLLMGRNLFLSSAALLCTGPCCPSAPGSM